jgi:hypothetical protein
MRPSPRAAAAASSVAIAVIGAGLFYLRPARGPLSDVEIRSWYQMQERTIPALDAQLKAQHKDARERALAAFEIRHHARLRSRALMREAGRAGEVELLEKRDLEKYGDKDGPTFDHLVAAATRKAGKSAPDEAVYQSIIDSAQRTNPWVDAWERLWD